MSFENKLKEINLNDLAMEMMSDLLKNKRFQKLWINLLKEQLIKNQTNSDNVVFKKFHKITKNEIIVNEALKKLIIAIQLATETYIKCCK